MSIVLLLAVFLFVPFIITSFINGVDPDAKQYITSSAARKIAPQHWYVHVALWAAIGVLSCAFWLHSRTIKTELERAAVESQRAELDADSYSPPAATTDSGTPISKAISYYEALKYERLNGFEGKDGEPLLLYARRALSPETGLWCREGAIIYPDGESAKISIGVLYDTDSWAYNSEYKIQKFRFGRAVKVKTALNRPMLQAMVQRSQHLITLGLSSMGSGGGEVEESDPLQQMNHLVAGARAYNLGYAVWELGWKPAKNIHPLTLGRAKTPPSDPVFEPLQRTAIIIGVNAPNVQVTGRDAVIAAMRLIELEHVNLGNYTYSVENPGRTPSLQEGKGYQSREDFHMSPDRLPELILDPIIEE